ncbi:MAG: dihydroneopterin aldolase family protein [Thermoplasmatota archaeon]
MKSMDYFNCGDRDRAVFEAGIKLASLYHQFIGSPVNKSNLSYLQDAMRMGMLTQPYVKEADVRIDPDLLEEFLSDYGYCSLNERLLKATVKVEFGGYRVSASLRWIEELNYPLMMIDDISEID